MKMIFILIILAVILLCAAIIVFFWAVKQRQFDDLDVHAYSVLKEDDYELNPDAQNLKIDSDLKDSGKVTVH